MNYNMKPVNLASVEHTFDLNNSSAYAGSSLVFEFMQKFGWFKLVDRHLKIRKANNASYDMKMIISSLVGAYIMGCERIDHLDAFADEPVLNSFLGTDHLPEKSLYYKDLRRFDNDSIEELHSLNSQTVKAILRQQEYVIFDVDTTVATVHGHQEGAEKGYNTQKPGRPSYRPSMIFDGISHCLISAELRPGNQSGSTGIIEQYKKAKTSLPQGVDVLALRADADYCTPELFRHLEEEGTHYAIKMRSNARLYQRLNRGIMWDVVVNDADLQIKVGSIKYRAKQWEKARRIVVVCKKYQSYSDNGQTFLPCEEYQFIATSLDWSPQDVWRFYNQRACSENYIKEAKLGFNIDSVPTGKFMANYADLLCKFIAYNLYVAFCNEVLPENLKNSTIRKFRRLFIAVPCILIRHARKWIMRLPKKFRYLREWYYIKNQLSSINSLCT